MTLCKEGQRLEKREGSVVVKKNGDCTTLYYHIADCEKCEQLRRKQ